MNEQKYATTPTDIDVNQLNAAAWNTHKVSAKDGDDFQGLIESIKANGMLHRIVVREIEDGKYEVIDGHRRLEAVVALGWDEVPCELVSGLTDEEAQAMTLTANVQRLENDPLLEAECIERLANAGKTYEQIAAILGKTARYVARRARIRNLTEKWRDVFAKGEADADTMEMVAAHEKSLQDKVFDCFNFDNDEGVDVDAIERKFRDLCRPIDEETAFDIEEAGCMGCPYNTATHGYLFPPEDGDVAGRCENAECYVRRWNAEIDARIEAIRKKKVTVLEAKQKWDIPRYWDATTRKTKRNSQAWVYTDCNLKHLVWSEPKVEAAAAPALTEEEKAEKKRIKKAHGEWKRNVENACEKVRHALDGDKNHERAVAIARTMVSNPAWVKEQEDDIVGTWEVASVNDDGCRKVIAYCDEATLKKVGIELTEEERKAVFSEDPALNDIGEDAE